MKWLTPWCNADISATSISEIAVGIMMLAYYMRMGEWDILCNWGGEKMSILWVRLKKKIVLQELKGGEEVCKHRNV